MGKVVGLLAGDGSAGYLEFLDALKALLDVFVDLARVPAVAEQFEEVVIGQEVEPGEGPSLGLEQAVEDLLTFVEALRYVVKVVVEVFDEQGDEDIGVVVNAVHVGTDPAVEDVELVNIADELPVLVLLGGKDGLKVDPLPLHLGEHLEGLGNLLQVVLPGLNLVLEVVVEEPGLLGRQYAHVVLEGGEDGVGALDLPGLLMGLGYDLEGLPLGLDLREGALDLVLLPGDLAGVVNGLGVANEVFLDEYFVEGEALALVVEVDVVLELDPVAGAHERLPQEVDQGQHVLEIVDGLLDRDADAPALDVGLLALLVELVDVVVGILL